jgi:RNA polymerase-binding transcription factor DksA
MRMTCLEKVRLKQLHEASLRRWGQIHEDSQMSGANTWLVQEVKRRALSERDAAKDRLELHEQHCEVCSRPIPRSRVRVA